MKKSFCHHQDNEEEISYCLVLWNPQFTLWRWNLLQIEELSWKPLNSLLTSQCIITERVGSQICEQRATKCKKNSAVSIVCKFTSKDKINVFLKKKVSHPQPLLIFIVKFFKNLVIFVLMQTVVFRECEPFFCLILPTKKIRILLTSKNGFHK